MKNLKIRIILTHASIIILFIAISLAYMYPLLEGKKLKMPDMISNVGMSKEIVDQLEKTGEQALWTNSMFGGMPAFQIYIIYPNNITTYVRSVFQIATPYTADIIFTYMLGFYILLLVLGARPWLAAIGAIAFGFSSYHFIVIEAGHIAKAYVIAYMAPVLAGFILTFRGKYLLGGVLTAIALTVHIGSNHLQITYYFLFILLFWGIAEVISKIKEKKINVAIKATGVLLIALIVSVGANTGNIWSTYEYSKHTMRGPSELTIGLDSKGEVTEKEKSSGLDKNYITAWSYGIGETFSFLIPNVKGGASGAFLYQELIDLNRGNAKEKEKAKKTLDKYSPEFVNSVTNTLMAGGYINSYWGDQPGTSGPVYLGAIVMFLFVLGMFFWKSQLKWYLLALTVLSIMLAWGQNFMGFTNLFLDYFPVYNKFRAVSMILVIAEFCIPLIAFAGLIEILKKPEILKENIKKVYFSFALTGGLCLIFIALPTLFFSFFSEREIALGVSQMSELESARVSVFRADTFRSFVFITLAFAAILLLVFRKVKVNIILLVLGVLILVDMWDVNKRYLNNENFAPKREIDNPFKPNPANQQILSDNDPHFRVFNPDGNPFNESVTSYFHKSVGGYHGAKLQRYQDIIDFHFGQKGKEINMKVLDMLNTKYIIRLPEKEAPIALRNPNALGNAWFVNNIKWVENPNEEILALYDFEPSQQAIVDKKFQVLLDDFDFKEDSSAFIKLESYSSDELKYKAFANSPQIVVFSEIYYPDGWEVRVNGNPTPHFRANYILRAMTLPEGENEIVFSFKPKTYFIGEKINLAFSIILILSVLLVIYQELISKNKSAKQN